MCPTLPKGKKKVLLLYSAARPDGFSSTLQPYPWQGDSPNLGVSHHLEVIRADGQPTSHAGLVPSTCPPYVLPVPILHLGMVEQVSDFKETCSASPPVTVMVVTAVGIEPRLPTYKPCLLTTTLPQLPKIIPSIFQSKSCYYFRI